MAVANVFKMLSAYLTVAATMIPPAAWTSAMKSVNPSKPWKNPKRQTRSPSFISTPSPAKTTAKVSVQSNSVFLTSTNKLSLMQYVLIWRLRTKSSGCCPFFIIFSLYTPAKPLVIVAHPTHKSPRKYSPPSLSERNENPFLLSSKWSYMSI